MMLSMASCPSCGAQGVLADAPCTRCGKGPARSDAALPALELDMPVRRVKKPAPSKRKPEEELSLELAIDPRTLIQPIEPERGIAPSPDTAPVPRARGQQPAAVHDLAFDARLLAEYGDPPGHWIGSPLYAWRVIKRQRELRQVLVGRREEAARTQTELEDALVAFAERARPTAERQGSYEPMLEEVKRAEEALRSRDRVLAADQDAQSGRLASVDAQLSKLEVELAKAEADERAVLTEIAAAQGALSRAEAKVKRADTELRAAQREPERTPG
jgi:hypothetical protein